MFYVQSVEHILDIHYIYIYIYVIVFFIYILSYTCISVIIMVLCYLYLRYIIHRLNFILYMYFCDIIYVFMYSLLSILWISDFKKAHTCNNTTLSD